MAIIAVAVATNVSADCFTICKYISTQPFNILLYLIISVAIYAYIKMIHNDHMFVTHTSKQYSLLPTIAQTRRLFCNNPGQGGKAGGRVIMCSVTGDRCPSQDSGTGSLSWTEANDSEKSLSDDNNMVVLV